MAMQFEELDDVTRQHMLREFEHEWASADRYEPLRLSAAGLGAFPHLMGDAISQGDEIWLGRKLAADRSYWLRYEEYWDHRKQTMRERRINVVQSAETLARHEFNTFYVRGLAMRLLAEDVDSVQVYRASYPKWEPAECSVHEGRVYPIDVILDGHRAGYHPPPGDPTVISIPQVPGCHHSVRRVR